MKKLLTLAALTSCSLTLLAEKKEIVFEPTESYGTKKQNTSDTPAVFDAELFNDLFNNANNLFRAGHYDEAATTYRKALALSPNCAHTHFNLAQALYWAKNYELALESYKKTVNLQPDHPHAYAQIGKLLCDVKHYNEALYPLKKALQINPYAIEPRLLLVRIYNNNQMYDDALITLQDGLNLDPQDINLNFELANTYNTINRLDEALALYQALDKRAPNNPSITYNIAYTLKKLGLVAESIPYYNKALAINPDHSDAQFSRGLAYLVMGDFEKGFEGYEWRYHKPEQGSLRNFTEPRWNGEDLNNQIILIHSEQGLGDTFQFIRYAQLLKEKYPTVTVIAAVQKPTVDLLKLCPYIDTVVAVNAEELPAFDFQAPIMSLPYIMQTRINTVPNTIPYLFANPQLVQEWKEKLSADKNFKIGICWQGNDNYATPQLRTAVALKSVQAEQFGPICKVPGVSVYSLQKTTGTDQLTNLPDDIKIISFDGDFDQSNGRFMDTAAVMRNLDLVITVDTSISHLAAALGVPTWIMLPNPADWRWMINRNDSPWYPQVTRLFKQPTPGDWTTMINEVAQELQKHLAQQ